MTLTKGLEYVRMPSVEGNNEIQTIFDPDTIYPDPQNTDRDHYDADNDYDDEDDDGGDPEADIQPLVANQLSLARSYLLCVTLGFLGAHYYYLGRRTDGLLYTATLGFFGIGWVIDWFRLSSLVDNVRRIRRYEAENGYALFAVPYGELEERSIVNAYLYCIPPWGLLGLHHMYLGTFRKNDVFHLLYTGTLGYFGIGWLFDIFRIPMLVRRANEDIRNLRSGKLVPSDGPETLHLDTAYSLAFPLGVLGLHHFYMKRYFCGFAYMFSFGLAGFGVLIDIFRLPYVFKRHKREVKELGFSLYHLDDAYIIWCPLGLFGLHHFYLRNWKMGVAYLFTIGFLGIGWLVDAFRMQSLVEQSNKTLDADLLWNHVFKKEHTSRGKTNLFVHSKLYNYPITDEDGNIQVHAFPLRPNGKPSWLLGWAWSPKSTNQNGFLVSDENNEEERSKTPLFEDSLEGAVGWTTIEPHENYQVSITKKSLQNGRPELVC